jgi:hypothetical protein
MWQQLWPKNKPSHMQNTPQKMISFFGYKGLWLFAFPDWLILDFLCASHYSLLASLVRMMLMSYCGHRVYIALQHAQAIEILQRVVQHTWTRFHISSTHCYYQCTSSLTAHLNPCKVPHLFYTLLLRVHLVSNMFEQGSSSPLHIATTSAPRL